MHAAAETLELSRMCGITLQLGMRHDSLITDTFDDKHTTYAAAPATPRCKRAVAHRIADGEQWHRALRCTGVSASTSAVRSWRVTRCASPYTLWYYQCITAANGVEVVKCRTR